MLCEENMRNISIILLRVSVANLVSASVFYLSSFIITIGIKYWFWRSNYTIALAAILWIATFVFLSFIGSHNNPLHQMRRSEAL